MSKVKSLIVGMGFGGLYKKVLTELGHEVTTVDPDPAKGADFPTLDGALKKGHYDTVNICTPNYSHARIALIVAPHASIVFVEKPGVANDEEWKSLRNLYPQTKFIMVKNNQWRDNIEEMKTLYFHAKEVKLHWINDNRVPNPGTWFTTKQLAYGGVSRDLIPHLLSLYTVLEPEWAETQWQRKVIARNWKLSELTETNYGRVDPNGIYNVDDRVEYYTKPLLGPQWEIIADWKSNKGDDIAIHFDNTVVPLGLCPESAYKSMIANALAYIDDEAFWEDQYRQDMWIHSTIAV